MWYAYFMSDIPWFPVLPEWFTDGACVGEDPNLFEPSATNATATAGWRNICRECPVMDMCREYAIKNEPYGNWGGLTANERKQVKRLGRLAGYQSLLTESTYEPQPVQVSDELDLVYVQHSSVQLDSSQTKVALADLSIEELLLGIL